MNRLPRDPFASRWPEPMTAERARYEVKRARHNHRRVPAGHPYGYLPIWFPYWFARLFGAMVTLFKPPV